MDRLPSYVVVITASNHPELLDRAVWRRFQLRLNLEGPDKSQIERFHNCGSVCLAIILETIVVVETPFTSGA